MELSNEQTAAIAAIEDWFNNSDQQIFRLFGYAGTGKTTLAKSIAAKFNTVIQKENDKGDTVPFNTVQFAAYTGKAAYVMQRNGCRGARTLHSLTYIPELELLQAKIKALREKAKDKEGLEREAIEDEISELLKASARAGMSFTLNEMSDLVDTRLLIVDECSMVDEAMARDLLSFGVKILVLGDPAQLPPVGGEGFFINEKPDVLLKQIHRQAEDNPIIKLASDVRNYRALRQGQHGESLVFKRASLTPAERRDLVLGSDIVLVGKNDTRRTLNAAIRDAKGYPRGEPVAGDQIICLRNTPDKLYLNGTIYTVKSVGKRDNGCYDLMVLNDAGALSAVKNVHPYHFLGYSQGRDGNLTGVPQNLERWEVNDIHSSLRYDEMQFDFAYAITVHKAQGSQWDNVYVKDESSVFRDDAQKWLYTAITRAAKRVVVEV